MLAKEVAAIDVPKYWSDIRDQVEEAMLTTRGKYRAHHIFCFLLKGSMQLWLALEESKILAFALSEIIQYPAGAKMLRVICVAGSEREKWQHLMSKLEATAIKNGCTDMELQARPGWSRIMKPQGYEITHNQLNKYLKE